MLPVLRKAIAAVDPNVPINEDRTVTEWLDTKFRTVRMTRTFFICFGAFALFLSAIGLYGVLAFTVSQRTREIGIRMALGAKASNVASTVVQQGVRLALFGASIGLVGALASARFIESYLYAVRPYDPGPIHCVRRNVGSNGRARLLHSRSARDEGRSHGGAEVPVMSLTSRRPPAANQGPRRDGRNLN